MLETELELTDKINEETKAFYYNLQLVPYDEKSTTCYLRYGKYSKEKNFFDKKEILEFFDHDAAQNSFYLYLISEKPPINISALRTNWKKCMISEPMVPKLPLYFVRVCSENCKDIDNHDACKLVSVTKKGQSWESGCFQFTISNLSKEQICVNIDLKKNNVEEINKSWFLSALTTKISSCEKVTQEYVMNQISSLYQDGFQDGDQIVLYPNQSNHSCPCCAFFVVQ